MSHDPQAFYRSDFTHGKYTSSYVSDGVLCTLVCYETVGTVAPGRCRLQGPDFWWLLE